MACTQIYVVDASAGSGKTHELAKRYVALLLNTDELKEVVLKNILAITFTNKASIEMKERILEFLKKISLDKFDSDDEKKDIFSSILVDKEYAQKKATIVLDYLIKNYNFFQVQTIDSFINSIILACAFRFNLSSSFKIRDDYQDYFLHSIDILIDRVGKDKEVLKLFEDFLVQYLYIENKNSWYPKKDILSAINFMYRIFNAYSGEFIKHNIKSENIGLKKKNVLKLMDKLYADIDDGFDKRFRNSLQKFLEVNEDGFKIGDLSKYFERNEVPVKKTVKVSDEVKKIWDSIRYEIRVLCEMEFHSLFNCYIDIFNQSFVIFRQLANDDDVLFLEDLNKSAYELVRENNIMVPELYLRIATQIKHFLIDEFQDTSVLQWRNLCPMVEEALSTGGTFFYVGDKKQAIFRFRGGDIGLFDYVKKIFGNYDIKCNVLEINRRSKKNIIEFTNGIFSSENLLRFVEKVTDNNNEIVFSNNDIEEIMTIFKNSAQIAFENNDYGYVKVEKIYAENGEESREQIKGKLINLIKDIQTRFKYNDIAIIVRKNEEVALISEWLMEEKYPVESEKTLNIRENPLIKELISFLKFLNSPVDNLSFASFIIGDIFSNASGIQKEEMEMFLFELNLKRNQGLYYYKEFKNKFPEVWQKLIGNFFNSVGFVPLYELVVSIIGVFKIFDNFRPYHGFFMKLLEFIIKNEDEYFNIDSFLEYFDRVREDELYVDVITSDAIRVITTHKAKGLEFGVVLIPFFEIDIRVNPPKTMGNTIRISSDASGVDKIKLMRLKKEYVPYSDEIEEIFKEEYKNAFIDELNNSYVAFTRARYEMYVFVSPRVDNKRNYAIDLIPDKFIEIGKKVQCVDKSSLSKQEMEVLGPTDYRNWTDYLKDEFVTVENIGKIKYGEIIHAVLSNIGNIKNENIEGLVENSIDKVRNMFRSVDYFSQIRKKVLSLLNKEEFREIFYVDGDVFNERKIVDPYGNIKRIDRLIVLHNKVLVVDYKSTRDNSREVYSQMNGYRHLIGMMYPKHEINGYIIYLDDMAMEKIK